MPVSLSHLTNIVKGEIKLTSSKSESNRALIIQALCADDFKIDNLAEAEDSVILNNLLNSNNAISKKVFDVGLAGTAMRFLTAYLSIQKGEWILTGASQMKARPIKVLVDALIQLGADIKYLEKEGFPPLKIIGKELNGGKVKIDGSISSQYISALLMIAPQLKNGLELEFNGELTSKPYVDMTINMMQHFGANVFWKGDSIIVKQNDYKAKDFYVEADWSAASYWYSIVALSKEANITLFGLKKDSLQGDAEVQYIYKHFGVETEFIENGIRLTKDSSLTTKNSSLKIDFINCPDIAQTVAVTCAALNVKARLTGLKTLRIKETDRVAAIQTELTKLGFHIEVDGDDIIVLQSLRTEQSGVKQSSSNNEIASCLAMTNTINTYDDHRMAMAFAPLALLFQINIDDKDVVKKSYPNFWNDLKSVGVEII